MHQCNSTGLWTVRDGTRISRFGLPVQPAKRRSINGERVRACRSVQYLWWSSYTFSDEYGNACVAMRKTTTFSEQISIFFASTTIILNHPTTFFHEHHCIRLKFIMDWLLQKQWLQGIPPGQMEDKIDVVSVSVDSRKIEPTTTRVAVDFVDVFMENPIVFNTRYALLNC